MQRINCISVRETSGVTILNSLGINSAVQVLDPVFLLDSIYWKNTFVNEKPNNDFVFVYDFLNFYLKIKRFHRWFCHQQD